MDVIKYVEPLLDGLTLIEDTYFRDGRGVSVALKKGVAVDLSQQFTERQLKESQFLRLAVEQSTIKSYTKAEYDARVEELANTPKEEVVVTSKIIQPGEDDNPYIAKLVELENNDVEEGVISEEKKMTKKIMKNK